MLLSDELKKKADELLELPRIKDAIRLIILEAIAVGSLITLEKAQEIVADSHSPNRTPPNKDE